MMGHSTNKPFLIMVAQIPIQLKFIDFDFWTKRIKLELVKNEVYVLSIKK